MIEPIRLAFELDCPATQASAVWARLVYSWHLRRARADATAVAIRFVPVERTRTRVEIEHRGWERLGAAGETRRDRNLGGWATRRPHDRRAAEVVG